MGKRRPGPGVFGERDYLVELVSEDGSQIEEVLAECAQFNVARAAYDAAVQVRPRPNYRVIFRHRARVIADSKQG